MSNTNIITSSQTSSKTTLRSFKKKELISKEEAYNQLLENQRKKYANFDFNDFANPNDRIMRSVLERVQNISGRKIFRDFNRHEKFADFLGTLRLMAQSKTKWQELSQEFGINQDAFSSYYKIMGNLPWYNRKSGEIVQTLYPNWDAVEGYVMYMASCLGIVLDYNEFNKIFNEDNFQSWVDEAESDIAEISGVDMFRMDEDAHF